MSRETDVPVLRSLTGGARRGLDRAPVSGTMPLRVKTNIPDTRERERHSRRGRERLCAGDAPGEGLVLDYGRPTPSVSRGTRAGSAYTVLSRIHNGTRTKASSTVYLGSVDNEPRALL